MVEYFLDLSVLNLNEIVQEPVLAEAGKLAVPQDPGIGVKFDEKAIERFSVDGWG